MQELEKYIRTIPDFPKQGIQFIDVTTLLLNPEAFGKSVDLLAEKFKDKAIDKVLGIEARGFIFGSVLAYKLGKGFIIVRKPGKLPAKTRSVSYELEYGTDSLEIHEDAISSGDMILIVDDLLATGGTVSAIVKMTKDCGGIVAGCAFIIELDFLEGRKKLEDIEITSLIHFK